MTAEPLPPLPDISEWLATKATEDDDDDDDRRRPRDLTEGEQRIYNNWSKCVAKLKTCRAERDECRGNLEDEKIALEKCQMRGPVVETHIPSWYWIGGTAAVIAGAIAGLVVGSAL